MSGMAEVLAAHQIKWKAVDHPTEDSVSFIPTCSKCGRLGVSSPDQHRADILTAAGFGPVKGST